MISSSYLQNDLNYGELISCITKCTSPKKIVEIGILDGYSLTNFIEGSNNETKIYAYDIFDTFNGNHANKEFIIDKFSKNDNVFIDNGDFYKLHEIIDNDIDILHIDIANDGDVFEFVIGIKLFEILISILNNSILHILWHIFQSQKNYFIIINNRYR